MMKKPIKLILYILLSIVIVVTIAGIATNSILKSKLENFLAEDLPENIECSYETISVNIFSGSASLNNPSLTIKNENDGVNYTFLKLKNLSISGMSYWSYLVKKEIHIGKIIIENPEVSFYKDRKNPPKDTIPQKPLNIGKPIYVDLLQLNHGEIAIYEAAKDSTKLFAENLSVKIEGIQINKNTLSQKLPFKYQSVAAKSDSIFVKANTYDNLTIADFSLANKKFVLNNLGFKTKYSKAKLSQIIKVERDHYDFTLKSLLLNQFDFGFENDQFFAKSDEVILKNPSLSIYRDKLVNDDLSIKPLYSKSLRELPFELTVDSIKINNGFIEYEEKVKEDNKGGSILFKDLNATFLNVSNTYKSPLKTELNIHALFMDKTPFSAQWSFDVQNPKDEFIFKGEAGVLEAEKMNRFTEPNMKVRLEGRVDRTYFTIDGNNNISQTDMKIKYSDFKVSVLQKGDEKKNKFLSAVVNIFISKDSEKNNDEFREASAEATRDKTKSIFNFLWISVKNALQKCVTGT